MPAAWPWCARSPTTPTSAPRSTCRDRQRVRLVKSRRWRHGDKTAHPEHTTSACDRSPDARSRQLPASAGAGRLADAGLRLRARRRRLRRLRRRGAGCSLPRAAVRRLRRGGARPGQARPRRRSRCWSSSRSGRRWSRRARRCAGAGARPGHGHPRDAEVAQWQGHAGFPADPGPVARRLQSIEQLELYLDLVRDLMQRTSTSIHGRHITFPSPRCRVLPSRRRSLLGLLSLGGLRNWADYGIRSHATHPERQEEYFALQSADSRAILQRERHGTLFADVERKLELWLRALWREGEMLVPYSTAFDEIRQPVALLRQPGHARARRASTTCAARDGACPASIATARCWRTWPAIGAGALPQIADNWSPFQRMAVEFFEDAGSTCCCARVPRPAAHLPRPASVPGAAGCDPETTSCLRHRLAMLSRAMLDPQPRLYATLCCSSSPRASTRCWRRARPAPPSGRPGAVLGGEDAAPERPVRQIHFTDTVIDYRDDNRQLWRFIEDRRRGGAFDEPAGRTARPRNRLAAAAPLPGMGLSLAELQARLGQRL
jgi:hypothetical protein